MGELPFVFGDGGQRSLTWCWWARARGAGVPQGRPFVGAAGKILDHFLTTLGLQRQNIYITNVVKQRPCRTSGLAAW